MEKGDTLTDYFVRMQNKQSGVISNFNMDITSTVGFAKAIAIFTGYLETGRPIIPTGAVGLRVVQMPGGGSMPVADSLLPYTGHDDVSHISKIRAVDAVVDDGTIFYVDSTHKIEVSTPAGYSIRNFSSHLQKNPARVRKLMFDANDKSVFQQLFITPLNPYKRPEENSIRLSKYILPANNNEKKIIIDFIKEGIDLQLDDQTMLILTIPGTVNGVAFVNINIEFELEEVANGSKHIFDLLSKVTKSRRAPKPVRKSAPIKSGKKVIVKFDDGTTGELESRFDGENEFFVDKNGNTYFENQNGILVPFDGDEQFDGDDQFDGEE